MREEKTNRKRICCTCGSEMIRYCPESENPENDDDHSWWCYADENENDRKIYCASFLEDEENCRCLRCDNCSCYVWGYGDRIQRMPWCDDCVSELLRKAEEYDKEKLHRNNNTN